jgi:hypothetical protein
MNIEAGCKAITINSKHGRNGISVIVGRFIGSGYMHPSDLGIDEDLWEISPPVKAAYASGLEVMVSRVPEFNLMRIDGFEEQDKVSDGKELINVD